jgi:hypothetical protein
MDLDIKDGSAEKLVSELWGKIKTTGFNAMSKNDFYDYVLYLFNKHNAVHFLDTWSNYENSMVLCVTEQKIKNTKQNIFLKYYSETEKGEILPNFFSKIAKEEIRLSLSDDEYSFVVEDLNTRHCLEGIMKNKMGISFDYQQNKEIVKISAKDFYILFGKIANMLFSNDKDAKETITKINKMEKDEQKKQLLHVVAGGIINAVDKITPLPVAAIADVAAKLRK